MSRDAHADASSHFLVLAQESQHTEDTRYYLAAAQAKALLAINAKLARLTEIADQRLVAES